MRADMFLDMYREVEDSLEVKYSGKKMHYSSVIYEYLNDPESKPIREKLDVCREIRNLLTHTSKIGGEEVVQPSESVCRELKACLDFINRPPLALDYATKGDSILRASLNQPVLKVMRNMEKHGYSHIPITENGLFVGVFSISTVFAFVLNFQGRAINSGTTISDLQELLPVKAHMDNYEFMPKDSTLSEVRVKFETVKGKNQRLSVIFITEHGSERERILGMLTPWDVLGEK